jgi:acyl-CoA thioesterase I
MASRYSGCLILFFFFIEPRFCVAQTATPAPGAYVSGLIQIMNTEWPKNRAITIACHGHSVPAGYFKTPIISTMQAYPHLFHAALCERFPLAVIRIIVTAIGGEQSEQGAARFERDVLDLHPDVITIDYGLNDRRIGLQRARQAWEEMITKAKARGIRVFLLTPTPDLSVRLEDPQDPLNLQAQQIRELARIHEVGLIDSQALFQEQVSKGILLTDLMSQINHPNRQGHELIARALLSWFPAYYAAK